MLYANLLLLSPESNTTCRNALHTQSHTGLRCVDVVSECICFREREGEMEDRGWGCRERASYVVGGRDWRERAGDESCWG